MKFAIAADCTNRCNVSMYAPLQRRAIALYTLCSIGFILVCFDFVLTFVSGHKGVVLHLPFRCKLAKKYFNSFYSYSNLIFNFFCDMFLCMLIVRITPLNLTDLHERSFMWFYMNIIDYFIRIKMCCWENIIYLYIY